MSFDLDDEWVWDFWTCRDDDGQTHLFFLHAPRSLGDPDRRHRHAAVGHAVSADLVSWIRLPDALTPQPGTAFDDLATWTGCTVRGEDHRWWMFTSGISGAEDGRVQRIGSSWSTDLVTWQRTDLVLEADPRWYDLADWRGETHWRDPWVTRDANGTWHMYVTAKAGGRRGGGVVGHATSEDLRTWRVRPPLSRPSGRFDQLEVVSLVEVEGRWALLFSCLGPEIGGAAPGSGGVWSVAAAPPGEPVDVTGAVRLTDESAYVGKVARASDGRSVFLAFRNVDADGRFIGGLSDPVPIGWRPDFQGLQAFTYPPGHD